MPKATPTRAARPARKAPAPQVSIETAKPAAKAPVSVITCDMEGRIETFNDGAHQIFQYTAEEVVGKKRVSLFSPGEVVLGHVPRWLKEARTKGAFEGDTVFVRKDGTRFAAHARITPTYKGGKASGVQTGYCGYTTELPGVDPATIMPKTTLGTRIFKGVVIGRLPFLTATLVPILVAAAFAAWKGYTPDPFPWLLFTLVMLGGIALHLAANVFNDYFDVKSGTDEANNDYFLPFTGGSRAIELGLITPKGTFLVGTAAIVAALAIAGVLVVLGRPLVLAFGAAGALMGFFYTAPPVRLAARRGLGELSSFLNFGPLMTAGAVYGISGHVGWDSFLLGIPIGLLTLAILWINEFPDAPSDRATGKNHLVATLGTKNARWGYVAIVAAAFAAVVVEVTVTHLLPRGALLALLALPIAGFAGYMAVRHYGDRALIKGCASTIAAHFFAGCLLAAGLVWLA
ncbi:MAG TPA: UbiA family prenyltransferase [Candidatus Thermoplasmatota archaeon]|nr:UbiA family prenyltransferase [Candidatus Thermoplasmatota archaeon]